MPPEIRAENIPCQTYHARVIERLVVKLPESGSVFKVYYLSILGRSDPDKYEWQSAEAIRVWEDRFRAGNHIGVGFVTAFPHITKIFHFSSSAETVLDVREYQTASMQPVQLERPDGSHEFSCYAEAIIAADEYVAWAQEDSVDGYLKRWSQANDFPIANHRKLAEFRHASG